MHEAMRLTPLRWMEAVRRTAESVIESAQQSIASDHEAEQVQFAALDVRALIAQVGTPNTMCFRGNYDPIRPVTTGQMDLRR